MLNLDAPVFITWNAIIVLCAYRPKKSTEDDKSDAGKDSDKDEEKKDAGSSNEKEGPKTSKDGNSLQKRRQYRARKAESSGETLFSWLYQ